MVSSPLSMRPSFHPFCLKRENRPIITVSHLLILFIDSCNQLQLPQPKNNDTLYHGRPKSLPNEIFPKLNDSNFSLPDSDSCGEVSTKREHTVEVDRRFSLSTLWKVGKRSCTTFLCFATHRCHQHLCPLFPYFLFFFCCPLSLRFTLLTLHPLFVVFVFGVVSFPSSLWLARCLSVCSLSLQLITSLCLRLPLSYLSSLNDCFSTVQSRLSSVDNRAK